jgi:PilZ domain
MRGTEKRRSQRLLLGVPLVVCGPAKGSQLFQEGTHALDVSAHGALVLLGTKVEQGEKVVVKNLTNWGEREGIVARVGATYAGIARVGIQFTEPAPDFWSVSSPPEDWNQMLNTRLPSSNHGNIS